MRIENAQKTVTVIVDRRVLADLLGMAACDYYACDEDLERLQREVESGDRCELYARDWPGRTE